MKSKAILLATSILAASAVGLSAQAQNAMNTIDELVVTAEKREQSLQDVPVAVTAFTSRQRALVGIRTVQDLTNFTPGFVYHPPHHPPSHRPLGTSHKPHLLEGPGS